MRPATRALLRQAQRALEAERGHRLDDDELIAALCGAVLNGSASGGDDTGRAKHQILVTTCETCGAAWQDAAGTTAPLDAADRARAECDAQRIASDGRAAQDVPPRIARLVHRRDRGKCAVPWCRASRYLEIHHVIPREQGGGHEPENLTLLCDGHHRAHHEGKLAISGAAPALAFHALDTHVGMSEPTPATHVGMHEPAHDAELVLTTLGFRAREAKSAVRDTLATLTLEPDTPLESIVRAALRRIT